MLLLASVVLLKQQEYLEEQDGEVKWKNEASILTAVVIGETFALIVAIRYELPAIESAEQRVAICAMAIHPQHIRPRQEP